MKCRSSESCGRAAIDQYSVPTAVGQFNDGGLPRANREKREPQRSRRRAHVRGDVQKQQDQRERGKDEPRTLGQIAGEGQGGHTRSRNRANMRSDATAGTQRRR